MRKLGMGLAALFAIAAMGSAQAVHLDIGGRGQALLYPYYTVNNSQQTLVSVTNTSSVAQAAKVRFNEGYNGRQVLYFNIFLAPFDSWTATVFALRDAGINSDGAAILTRDTSCTAPMFAEDNTSINGTPYVAFRDSGYMPPFGDGGPYTISRTREGSMEIIAMSNVAAPLSSAIAHGDNGSPPTGCAQVRLLGGDEPELSSAPSGGMIGAVSIINVARGTYLSARAEALVGFTGVSLFTGAPSGLPDLASVNDGPGTLANRATAQVFDAVGNSHSLTYPGPDQRSRRVDAVSAVLMADRIYNEYQIAASLGAASDWLVTFPTKAFYTDPAYLNLNTPQPAVPPFPKAYAGTNTSPAHLYSQATFDNTFYTPDGKFGVGCTGFPLTGIPCDSPFFPLVTNVFPIHLGVPAQPSLVLGSTLTFSRYRDVTNPVANQIATAESGTMSIHLNPSIQMHKMLPSVEGKVLVGLPIIGFWASNIVNANVTNGVLANYAAAVRHATSVTCVKASDGTPCD